KFFRSSSMHDYCSEGYRGPVPSIANHNSDTARTITCEENRGSPWCVVLVVGRLQCFSVLSYRIASATLDVERLLLISQSFFCCEREDLLPRHECRGLVSLEP